MSGAPDNGVPEGCALVTGASRGIGEAIATALAADGWPVGVNFRADEQGAERVVAAIEANGGTAVVAPGDVTDPATPDALFTQLEERFGPVLVLVNNAGTRADGLTVQMEDDAWQRVLETNLSAAFRLTRRAVRTMTRQRFGRVINIASIVGTKANAGQANYAAAKAGLIGFTKTVAVEVARRGVTVNAVAPGLVETELTEGIPSKFLEAVPARRAGRPEDIAACVRFLASESAGYVTGTTLTVDGGLSA
ncbi:MAG: 3-oxoacyl-ACP reductase FabG [Solirubrobacterales bacterium]|nr:3-oxoacyl-ACP reductase FabG [Solirubrobacterales bacterium]